MGDERLPRHHPQEAVQIRSDWRHSPARPLLDGRAHGEGVDEEDGKDCAADVPRTREKLAFASEGEAEVVRFNGEGLEDDHLAGGILMNSKTRMILIVGVAALLFASTPCGDDSQGWKDLGWNKDDRHHTYEQANCSKKKVCVIVKDQTGEIILSECYDMSDYEYNRRCGRVPVH